MTHTDHQEPENTSTYFSNADSLVETSRVLLQERYVTTCLSLLAPGIDGVLLHDVLDIGCGPGGWLLDLHQAFPHIRGTGVDISESMLHVASLLHKAEGTTNTLINADARKPLPFAEERFDYIQLRLAQSFLHQQMWPFCLQECYRVLRPGGTLCISDLEITLSNMPATDKLHGIAPLAFTQRHLLFSPNGRTWGLMCALRPLLQSIGFQDRRLSLFPLSEISDQHELQIEQLKMLYLGMKPILLQAGHTEEELDLLFEEALQETHDPGYTGISILFTWASTKP